MTGSYDANAALRAEAAAWVARMERPDAMRFQPKLDRWLEADPDHRAAYERIHAQFEAAQVLRASKRYKVDRVPTAHYQPRWTGRLATASLSLIFLAGLSIYLVRCVQEGVGAENRLTAVARSPEPMAKLFASRPGAIRTIMLPDGSSIVLDAGARLAVVYDTTSRTLTLEQGRARFSVAHESRPFVVHAGSTSVIAHGTIFDVAIGDKQHVEVALLQGKIDITRPRLAQGPGPAFSSISLRAGEQIAFGKEENGRNVVPLERDEIDWPQGMIDCDGLRLDQLLVRANRYATRPILLADPSLGALRASGRFRISEPDRLADNLGQLFALKVDRSHPDALLLERSS